MHLISNVPCLAGFLLLFAGGCAKGPTLELVDKELNLGKVKTETATKAQIRIRNSGNEVLKIEDVEVGCGCTTPTFPKELAAGQQASITIDFLPNLLWSGPRSDTIKIKTNDPEHRAVIVKMNSVLDPPLRMTPKSPTKLVFAPGSEQKVSIEISGRDPSRAPVEGVTSSDPRVSAKLSQEGGVSKVAVTFGGKKVAGDYDIRLQLKTAVADVPFAEFELKGQAKDSPFTTPSLVQVRQLRASEKNVRLGTVAVHSRGGDVKVLSADSDDDSLTFKIEKERSGKNVWVSVIAKGGWPVGRRSKLVRILTDHPTLPVIEVPVVVNVVAG